MKQRFFLIDGSALFYRSFYGISQLHNSKGEPTQAILGFLRSLQKILKANPLDSIIIAWDAGLSGRREIFSDYKTNREKAPAELISQKTLLLNILDKIEICQMTVQGYEADDVICSLNNILKKDKEAEIIITTADKDLFQLVDENTTIYDPFKEKTYNTEEILKKFEFGPEKIMFYFSLLGDSSDNIPGVAGIGKVFATKLVKDFSNLKDLYENLSKLKESKLYQKLIDGKEKAFLSQDLFQLRDLKLELPEKELLLINQLKWKNSYSIFEELELKSLLPKNHQSKLQIQNEINLSLTNISVQVILNKESLKLLFAKILEKKTVAIDLETTGLEWQEKTIVGISFSVEKQNAFYLPLSHLDEEKNEIKSFLKFEDFGEQLLNILADKNICKIFHNAKFDLHFLKQKLGNFIILNLFDTALAARLLFPEWIKVGLKSLSQNLLGTQREDFSTILKKHGPDFRHIPFQLAVNYAGLDADQTIQIFEICSKLLEENPKISHCFFETELPLLLILEGMETIGILIDKEKIKVIEQKIDIEIEEINNKIKSFLEFNHPEHLNINLNSPKQLQNFLFNVLNLKTSKKTGAKAFSTDVEVLTELAKVHVIPEIILTYRKLAKIKSTYLNSLIENQSKITGAIHSDFSQIVAATGRLASNNPNLQNIPNEWNGINIRSAFVSRPNTFFLSADYSQVELRVLAELCQDKNLLHVFLTSQDIHTKTATEIFNKTINEISNEERSIAKRINFSILYGLSPFSLAKEMNISNKDAKNYIERFFAAYPDVQPWMEASLNLAKKNGFAQTYFGRKRWFRNLNDKNQIIAKAEARAAINSIIQGTAADLIKNSMIKVDSFLKKNNYSANILLQVHDEILLEINNELLRDNLFMNGIKESMEKIVSWQIPLIVNLKTGTSWGFLKKY